MTKSNIDSSGNERPTCPKCGEVLRLDEEWRITDRSLIGTTVEAGESIQGDYAHARCMGADTEHNSGDSNE